MVEIYARLIIHKRKTLQQVHEELRVAVQERLLELGFDENGDAV